MCRRTATLHRLPDCRAAHGATLTTNASTAAVPGIRIRSAWSLLANKSLADHRINPLPEIH
jgi:hypothetical protein